MTPGHLVFHDGAQRDGTLHGVPKHLAMHWQKHHFATIADELVGAGAASNTEHVDTPRVQDVAMTASFAASHDLRDADTDPTVTGGTPGAATHATPIRSTPRPGLLNSRAVREDFVCTVPTTSPEPGSFGGLEPSCDGNPLQRNRIDLSPYRLDSAADASAGPVSGGEARTGSRVCRNCGAAVSGRRKWCSEACRLQAYRQRGGGE